MTSNINIAANGCHFFTFITVICSNNKLTAQKKGECVHKFSHCSKQNYFFSELFLSWLNVYQTKVPGRV